MQKSKAHHQKRFVVLRCVGNNKIMTGMEPSKKLSADGKQSFHGATVNETIEPNSFCGDY